MNEISAAGWHPDPTGRHEYRWWDGTSWTEHVTSVGRPERDPIAAPPPPQTPPPPRPAPPQPAPPQPAPPQPAPPQPAPPPPRRIDSLLDYPTLRYAQRAKRLEVNTEYDLMDSTGRFVGHVAQVGQSLAKKALRAATSFDELMSHRFELTDTSGRTLLEIERPRHLGLSVFEISGNGTVIGHLRQHSTRQAAVFTITAGEHQVGTVAAGPTLELLVTDQLGNRVAEVIHQRAQALTQLRESLDSYALTVQQPVPDPLRTLLFALPIAFDLAFNQRSLDRNRL